MAVLTNADYQWMKQRLRRSQSAWNIIKAWGLTKQQLKDAVQEIEDWEINGFSTTPISSLKDAIETHTGAATNNQLKQLINAWVAWSVKDW